MMLDGDISSKEMKTFNAMQVCLTRCMYHTLSRFWTPRLNSFIPGSVHMSVHIQRAKGLPLQGLPFASRRWLCAEGVHV